MGCIPGCWGSWLTPFQGCSLTFGRSQRAQEIHSNERQILHPSVKRVIYEILGFSVPLHSLEKSWSKPSWNVFLGTWRRSGGLERVSMDLPMLNHAWPACLLSVIGLQIESWTMTKQKFTVCYVKDKVGIYFSAWSYILSLLPPFWGKWLLKLGIHELLGIS